MEIILNGEPRAITAGLSVLGLVRSLEMEPSRVAIELNGQILKRDRWADTPLEAGMHLELVSFVGGG